MSLTVLLTGGRAAATLELARLFDRAGHRVVLAEHIWWHLSRYTRAADAQYDDLPWPNRDLDAFADRLAAIIAAEGVDLYIPTAEEVFWVARVRDRLPERCEVFVAEAEVLDRVHDKWSFVQRASRAGLRVPDTRLAQDGEALRAALAEALAAGRRVVLKPAFSRFATFTCVDPRSLDALDGVRVEPGNPWLVQDLVEGRHVCTFGLAHQGRLVAHGAYPTRYTLGAGAAVTFEALDSPEAEAWAESFVAAEGLTGHVGLDLIVGADGEAVGIECNPRLTSGVHLFYDQPELLERYRDPGAERLHPAPPRPGMLGVSMLIHLASRVRDRRALAAWWRTVRASREVVHSLRDPVPALWRYVWLGGIVARARRRGVLPQEAAALEVIYDGPEAAEPGA